MNIRTATLNDLDSVRCVHLCAFSEGERDLVSRLAVDLLCEEAVPPVFALVAEIDNAIVGHVAFSPLKTCDMKEHVGYILAPLAVRPGYQKRGIASRLIEAGIRHVSAWGPGVLLVYGDPGFYSRFGFTVEYAEPYTPPYPLQYPFGWQGMALRENRPPPVAIRISCVSSLQNPALW
jgi:putative acetyltransferase